MTTDKITNLGKIVADFKTELNPSQLKQIKDLFGLDKCEDVLIVQKPGDIELLAADDVSRINPDAKYMITRIDIELSDWEVGQFSSYDDYQRQHWKAGDVSTYNWQSVKRATANTGLNTRITLQLTGIVTEKTTEFMNRLKRFGSHQLELTDNSWF